jgi:uncharacterized protein (DUF1800 family)
MVEFWSNHFNVAIGVGGTSSLLRPHYQVHAIRAHALGTFRDLLVATAEHPAMLRYLNGAQSSKKAPNENFARELLELHTLGVTGGYTETDVKQAALLLTGWTVPGHLPGKGKPGAASPSTSPGSDAQVFSQAVFRPERHYVGPVTVMGRQYPNAEAQDGVAAGRRLFAALAVHPSTASHIAFQLARRFVADSPPDALVARLARIYLDHDTQIVPVLRALFTSPEFAASAGQKVRRPFERVAATLRVLAPTPAAVTAEGLLLGVRAMTAHRPFDWATPDGYPDVLEVWSSPGVAVDLLNYGSRLLAGTIKGLGCTAAQRFTAAGPTTPTAAADAAARIVLQRPPTEGERSAVLHLLAGSVPGTFRPNSAEQARAGLLAQSLLLASPSHLSR